MQERAHADRAIAATPTRPRNRFDRMEWAGAFGDLGTLIPFTAAYVGVLKMDSFGILFAFGSAMIACGLYYRTPVPVQPMKAIGAVAAIQAAQTIAITPAAVYGAGLATGLIWLVLGATGTAARVVKWVPRPVLVGIVLGLGMGFMLEGIRMMATQWAIAAVAFVGTHLLLVNRNVPAMFLLLAFGAVCGVIRNPALRDGLAAVAPAFRAPDLELTRIDLHGLAIGVVFLALPQLPLTLGNAVMAIREENNRLFPDRRVTDNRIAISTGLVNLFGSVFGGVPMCHGAGGMAGHVAFGARTGGATIIAGAVLLVLALFFSGSIALLFELFPPAVLGVILFFAGAQLALGSCHFGDDKGDRFVAVVTAAFALWNVGLAFVVGIGLAQIAKRGLLRL